MDAARPKGVICGDCGSAFSRQSNLNRHVETKHADQTTDEAVAGRLKLNNYQKTTRCKRRKTDPVYREKMRMTNQTYRVQVKARKNAETSKNTEDAEKNTEDDAEVEKGTGPCEVTPDVVPPPPTAEDDGVGVGGAAGKPVKKSRKNDNPKGAPLRVTTTVLTTANVTNFFAPKYDTPRSKAQRTANPRSSVI
jgi:hypothetical protein